MEGLNKFTPWGWILLAALIGALALRVISYTAPQHALYDLIAIVGLAAMTIGTHLGGGGVHKREPQHTHLGANLALTAGFLILLASYALEYFGGR